MTVHVVEVESNYEDVTKILYAYRVGKLVHPYLLKKEFNVNALLDKDATRSNFAQACKVPAVQFITGSGHGFDDLFTGDKERILWQVGDYDPKEANGKIIHLMSCLTAKSLGHDLVDNGCLAFFGYDVSFTFYTYDDADPLNDPRVAPFFECDSAIDKFLADGCTAREAYTKTMQLYEEKFEELMELDSSQASYLRYNFQNLQQIGNPDISLSAPQQDEIEIISLGKPVSNKLAGTGAVKEYVIKGIEGGKKLNIDLNGPSSVDFDIYIKSGSKATLTDWDYRGYTDSASEEITIDPTVDGDYYIIVHAYNGEGLFSLKANIAGIDDTENELIVGETITDKLGNGESKSYILRGLEGGKDLVVMLNGPSLMDFDLYLKHKSVPTPDDWDVRGYTGTSREKVRVYPTKYGGNYYVMVHSTRGSGDYTLKAVV